jgi:hypothetical protein
MAQRTRALRVKFYNPDTLVERSIPQGYLTCVAGSGKGVVSKVGSGSAKIPIDQLAQLSGSYTAIQMHDIAVVYNINGGYTEQVGTFVVRSQKLDTSSYGGASYMVISGPNEMYYLGKSRHYFNVGKEYTGTVMNHDGQGGSSAGWPFIYLDHGDMDLDTEGMTGVFWPKWTLKKAQSIHTGETILKLVDSVETSKAAGDKWAIGDDISLVWQFSPYGQHTTSVVNVQSAAEHGQDSYYWVTIQDPMEPKKADDHENTDPYDPPERFYPTFSSTIFKGDPVSIQMQSGLWHTTRIRNDARYNGFFIEEAAPDDILPGASFKWWNSREPNDTNDISLMTQNLLNWTVNGTASSKGSFHVIDTRGADILQLLMKTAEATNDYFYTSQSGPTAPSRTLEWKTASPFSNLTLTTPATWTDALAKQAGGQHCFIHSISKISRDLPISVAVPKGGANADVNVQFNLGNCSESPAAGLARLHGITVGVPTMTRTYTNGSWRITNTDAGVPIEEYFEFEDIYPRTESSANITEAANIMQARCALILFNKQATEEVYSVTTVLPDGKEIAVGETIYLVHSDSEWDVSELLYIAEYEHFVVNSGKQKGIRQTKLQLSSDGPRPRDTGSTAVARGIRKGITSTGFGVGTGGLGGGNPEDGVPALPTEITIETSLPTGALTASGMDLTFVLNHGAGLAVSTNNVTLDVPTVNLSAITPNAVDASGHTHAIDSTADPITNPLSLVATDANSRTGFSGLGVGQLADADELQLATTLSLIGNQTISSTAGDIDIVPAGDLTVDADIIFVGSQALKTSAGNMFIQPGGDLYLDPSGSFIQTRQDMKAEGYTSGFLGNKWSITDAGQAQFRGIQADELRVKVFSADHTLVSTGSHYVSPGMGEVETPATVPAVSSSTTITFYDNPVIGAAAIFRDGAKGFIRISDSTAGGLYYALVWGTVTSYSDNADGTQDWTFTTGSLGAAVDGDTIPEGAVFVSWGLPGMGVWSVTTNDLGSGPYAQIQTWSGTDPWTASNRKTRVRLGDLQGVGHQGYGLFAGMDGTLGPRLLLSESKAEFHSIPISMYQGTADLDGTVRIYGLAIDTAAETDTSPNGDVTAGPTGEALVRSTGAGTWESHIDNLPEVPGTDYLRNAVNMGLNYAAFNWEDLTEDSGPYMIRGYFLNRNLVDDYISVRVRLYDPTEGYGWLTDEITLWTSDMAANDVGTIVEREMTNPITASGLAWAGAQLYIYMTYNVAGGNEVLRIEPNVVRGGQGPYIALGNTIPLDFWTSETTSGIWMGRTQANDYALRVGGGGSNTSVPAMTYTSASGLKIWSSSNKTTPVLHFDNSGNAYVEQTITLNTSTGLLVAGELTLSSSGIYMNPGNAAAWEIDHAYAYKSGATTVSGMYGKLYTGANELIVQTNAVASYDGEVFLYARGGASRDASIDLSAISDNGSGVHVGLDMDTDSGGTATFTVAKLIAGTDMQVYDGLAVGTPFGSPADGSIILQQGALDGPIIEARSTDLSVTGQGLNDEENFFQLQKADSTNGGTMFVCGSDSTYAAYHVASVNTATTTQNAGSHAAIIFEGRVDNAAMGSTANIMVVRNQFSGNAMIIRADGHIHSNYGTAMTVFDKEDDDLILRELEYQIAPENILQRGMDKLEDKIAAQGELIIALLEKLGMGNNPGTIIENTA